MPKGIFIRTEEYRQKLRKPRSEETKQKIRDNHADFSGENNPNFGKIPWNKGLKGQKRKPLSEEHKEKISISHRGIKCAEETKQKISNANKGQKRKPLSEEHKEDIRKSKRGKLCGIDNPNWKGGITNTPYCEKWTEELREEIRKRDNRICQNCGKTELNNNRKLSVHHIHYDKENCYPDLIALCNGCNAKVNQNRDYWEKYFMKKLEERNLLNYFEKQKANI